MAKGEITVRPEVRPCTVHKKKGLFHKWTCWDDRAYGIVELEDGHVVRVRPEKIRFTDTESLIHSYFWDYWED